MPMNFTLSTWKRRVHGFGKDGGWLGLAFVLAVSLWVELMAGSAHPALGPDAQPHDRSQVSPTGDANGVVVETMAVAGDENRIVWLPAAMNGQMPSRSVAVNSLVFVPTQRAKHAPRVIAIDAGSRIGATACASEAPGAACLAVVWLTPPDRGVLGAQRTD